LALKISVNNLIKKLNNLKKDYSVFVPILKNNEVKLEEFDGKNIYTGVKLPVNSIKELVLPQRDCMFKYRWKKENGYSVEEIKPNDKKTIAFCRPCDAQSLSLLDKIFLNDKQDIYYKDKRNNLIVISIACSTICNTCFCTTIGGSPFNEKGSDIFGIMQEDSFILKGNTDKGISLLKDIKGTEINDEIIIKEKDRVEKSIKSNPFKVESLKEKANSKYQDKIWEELGEVCIGCGACTYLCPTCHCFDIQEEVKKNTGLRVRNWDSCQFAIFTKEASGHNPRGSGKERMRQRFEHKLNYIPENINEIGCVGCGRCVVFCPVNIDIREVIEKIME
jgi:ferredoxin